MESLARPNDTFELIDLTSKIRPQGASLLQLNHCKKNCSSIHNYLIAICYLIVHKITMTKTSKAK